MTIAAEFHQLVNSRVFTSSDFERYAVLLLRKYFSEVENNGFQREVPKCWDIP